MNKVFINDHDIIEIIVDGDQTVTSVNTMADTASSLIQQYSEGPNKALILDNLMNMGTVPPEARRVVVEQVRHMDFKKFAFVGRGTALRLAANLLLQAIGKGSRIKYFDDYNDAIAWLTKKNSP
jgi:hypothetical protein